MLAGVEARIERQMGGFAARHSVFFTKIRR
jgi:hypothetical protein